MSDKVNDTGSPSSPDRKRSLEDESASDDDETRGGRFKRQALNSTDSAHPNPPARRDADDRQAAGDAAAAAAEEPPFNSVMSMRALISMKEAGIVIGRSGKNVADIREKSGAKVTVSENIPGAQERVLTISGPLDTVAKAFSLVALKVVEEHSTQVDVKQRHTSIRVLVPHTRMGSVIGKQGAKIKEIQEASGSRITASEEMLPNSTERAVNISGVVDSIHIATYHIGMVLQDHPERAAGTVFYKPVPGLVTATSTGGGSGVRGNGLPMNPAAGNMGYQGAAPAYGGIGGLPPQAYGYGMAPVGGPMGGMPGPHGGHIPRPPMLGGPGPTPMAPLGAVQMQQIFIPNEMVGAIIGKNGTKINEIRNASGCNIKIGEAPTDGSTERLVTITGSPEANQMALYMLYQKLETEKGRMAAGSR
ncbi:hypothetical protein HDU76_004929 [Blyttiomyces sp. JEL0837]|nr:hypothetical protein HDU76_004929 [Blyttiomyces sp. JEL0837]